MAYPYSRLVSGILNVLGLFLVSLIPLPRPPPLFIGLFAKILQAVYLFYKIEYMHMVWRWIKYEPIPAATNDDELPTLSVVIPVYNESEFVTNSIKSVEFSDYPKDKIELIVVDDGSTDDTWEYVNKAVCSIPISGISLRLLQHPVNMGKRKAIHSGFSTALGSIVICLDSDSVVERGSFRNIVSPLMKDPTIGAVAGHLIVSNVSNHSTFSLKCLLPRLLDIVYDHIGNLPRSALSAEGFVTILPGAFSAFRAEAVQCHVETLCTSTFLGRSLKHGEDMELAFRILSDGWKTVYQSNAVVHTMAPENLEKAFLMFSRWERTNYTFLFMGYPALTTQKALKLWLAIRSRRVQSSLNDWDKEKQEGKLLIAKEGMGSIYPFINSACVWLKGPLMIFLLFTLLRSLILYPLNALWILLEISSLTAWRSLMLIPDALRHKETNHVSDIGGLEIYHIRGRLVWRLVFSWLAGMFQLVVLSWTSILGLVTLQSQSWGTR